MDRKKLQLKKVRVHNLKNIDLELDPHQLIVFTGVSGSGKSSLAFDTIYVEGQRRYIESLSHYARRYMGDLTKPDAESIEGVAPSIAIEQKLASKTPRSTVGTITQIYDFLRILYARIGIPHCPVSKEPVQAQSQEKIIQILQHIPKRTKIILLAPYVRGKKGELKDTFQEIQQKGFTRIRLDGEFVELTDDLKLDKKKSHDVDLVMDRIVVSPDEKSRLKESALQSLEIGKGYFSVYFVDSKEEKSFSQFAYSPKSGLSYGPLEPHDFSFNHPSGMCPKCQGIGEVSEFDLEKIIDPELSIAEDCCKIASSYQTVRYGNIFDNLARLYKFDINTPWKDLPKSAKDVFLNGSPEKWLKMRFVHPQKKTRWTDYIRWKGVLFEAHQRLNEAKSEHYRKNMHTLMKISICPECLGKRIRSYPAACKVGGKTLPELTEIPLELLSDFFDNLYLSKSEMKIAEELLKEIKKRIAFLLNVGTGYLSLSRTSPTLSGGESQRVRLAAQIGSGLIGTLYVLDEPSIGLHPQDQSQLIATLKTLSEQGNTVIVVEHDRETMLQADTIVEIGPFAGKNGGEIIAKGTVEDIIKTPESLTGKYLSFEKQITKPQKRKKLIHPGIEIQGATHHNLKKIDVAIPLQGLICITGVSGSGKSSLIRDILFPYLSNHLHHSKLPVGDVKKITGMDQIDKVIAVDQSPIGRTPRSNPATYIKLLDDIRDLFTSLPESKARGYRAGHFSFNVKEGSCSYCSGLGVVKVDMDFMEDAWIECMQCRGKRFDPEILTIQYKGKSIYDVLELDVASALEVFSEIPNIAKKCSLLKKVGLDYIKLGQSSTTLSGGEAQRIKLAKELVRPSTGKTLYILDEPTTGLHFYDIEHLIGVFRELISQNNTVVVIEHNMDFVQTADWIIDLGPKAGIHGGEIVGTGTPEQIAKKSTPTAIALKEDLSFKTFAPKTKKAKLIKNIEIEEAQQNNLKQINLHIPRNQMTVFTGPSGSGKSSLAFDTIYAEGQRRYVESLAPFARQFIKLLDKPKVKKIEGLSPAISIEQKKGAVNPRSTVGTITEIYDLLRVLYAHLGTAYCPETGEKIQSISKEFVVRKTLELPENEKIYILSPLQLRSETFQELILRLQRQGFLRIRLNDTYYELDEDIPYDEKRKNQLYLVVDRMTVLQKNQERLFEAIEVATQFSNGFVTIATPKKDHFYNLAFAVISTGKSYPPLMPQSFSFNSEQGMCLECQGIGTVYGVHLLDHSFIARQSLVDLLRKLFKKHETSKITKLFAEYFSHFGIDPYEPIKKLTKEQLDLVLYGTSENKQYTKNGVTLEFQGIETILARLAKFGTIAYRYYLLPHMHERTCPHCQGTRLNPLARGVKIQNQTLPQVSQMAIEDALQFFQKITLEKSYTFLQETLNQILKSLRFLNEIGLNYISLDRKAPTLSGGELQRIRLARQLGSSLTSCIYVLDEPTIGLHPHNSRLLNQALDALKKLNNTLIVVEHDPLTIQEADYIVDFGPQAGALGGQIVAQGTLETIQKNPNSVTGPYLSGKKKISIPKKRRPFKPNVFIKDANIHNLKNLSIELSTGCLHCFTGVSGSGKSTLMHDVLAKAMKSVRRKKKEIFYENMTFIGLHQFDQTIILDQNPIGSTIRSDVSTYSDTLTPIRSLYASLPQAKAKGLKAQNFSYHHKKGMCQTCFGMGYKTIDLQFLPSVQVECDSCMGFRLNPLSLEITYRGKHLGHILRLTVEEALEHFSEIPKVVRKLKTLISVGLGYLQLGQSVQKLSGGEAQRLRLSTELSKRSTGKTLYLMDEPTTGLHFEDIERLIPIFHKLVDQGNTLIIIEHQLDLIAQADWVIDLGPEAGEKGGYIVTQGSPEKVSLNKKSYTGKYLKELI